MMRFFIGFDIGDGESIVEMATSATDSVQPATMPGQNASGQSIPTLFAVDQDGNGVFADQVAADYENLQRVEMNFKRCPGDLIQVSQKRENELLQIPAENLLREPEFCSGAIQQYAQKLCTFINIVLQDEKFMERARAFSMNCDDCVISVGHPTNWSALDCHIYRAILLNSIIGEGTYLDLPMELSLESESRAAFLYIKNTYLVKLKENEFVGLMDVGSSTIDISVMTKNSNDCVYDSGSNYLGARSIDYLILNYYIEEIERKTPEDAVILKDILANDEAAFRSLLINCRFAKETIFSSSAKDKSLIKARIFFGDFDRVTLTWTTLVDDICSKRAIAPVLEKYCGMPEEKTRRLGSKSWIAAFRSFLGEQLDTMKRDYDIQLTKLFLTGSASRMEFVRTICKEMIPDLNQTDSLFDDTNPSNAIANGLARVGLSDIRAIEFKEDMEKFYDKDKGTMFTIIKRRIPDLITELAAPIADTIQYKVFFPNLKKWKNGEHASLQDMMNAIENQCKDEEEFNKVLSGSKPFNDAVESWMVNKVGHDIAVELQKISIKHRVNDFTIDQFNAFKAVKLTTGGEMIKRGGIDVITQFPSDQIAYAIAAIAGIVSYLVLPYITGVILGLVMLIFETLAVEILAFLMTNPYTLVIGFAAIAGLLAMGVVSGYKKNKARINKWLLKQNMPRAVRNAIDIDKIAKQLEGEKYTMTKKINDAMNQQKVVEDLGKSIYANVIDQVEKRANQIKYEIQNRAE